MDTSSRPSTRRDFLKTSAALAAATVAVPAVHAAGGDVIRVGLIGCGGRGTGAAEQACAAGPDVRLVAMGDMFPDRLQKSKQTLKNEVGDKFAVKDEHCFTGFDAYKQVIASGVDVVLLCTPPHFRPMHLKAAVDAGKHVFAEKPMAVDGPGVRSVLASSAGAKKKNLSVVAGFCYRYEHAKRELMLRVHCGEIGDIVALHTSYNAGPLWHKPRQPGWSDMEWQLRNWLYFTWLSGDHICEQHCHSLDKMAWAMKDQHPVSASGMGGRQTRTGPEFGHIFDHHAVVFEYPSGVKLFAYCRQQAGCHIDVSDYVLGTSGTADVMKHTITSWDVRPPTRDAAKVTWRAPRNRSDNMYQNEHDDLFASIRSGKPINDGEWMAKSTLLSIMGRMATYTGQVVTWEEALNSKEDLTPPSYTMGSLPTPPVPMPGVTKVL